MPDKADFVITTADASAVFDLGKHSIALACAARRCAKMPAESIR
jgi:isochorismate hydrolase